MLTIRTYIARSFIDGMGVFLAEPVKAGQRVWEFNPIIDIEITPEQLAALPSGARETAERHSFIESDGRMILARDNGVFFNHSDDPNTVCDAQGNRAVRDLPAGTELTESYRSFPRGACNEFLFNELPSEER